MKVHEYQARQLLADAGLPVPPGILARTGPEAADAFKRLAVPAAVVKAQVFAGGRGKAGGVRLVRSAEQARAEAECMLSRPLVTHQTGPAGVPVRAVLLTPAVEIAREFYIGVAIDRSCGQPVLIASAQGGVEIEQVARDRPEAILRQTVDAVTGLGPEQSERIAAEMLSSVSAADGASPPAAPSAGPSQTPCGREMQEGVARVARLLARFFIDNDCSLAEINPLVVTRDCQLLAIDAKLNFDDNALFRHPQIAALADPADENPAERRARQAGLSYIAMDGNIGCVVNGAGLAMATMDLVKLHGGEPANFLDVGGGVTREAAVEAFRILLADQRVRAVLVNIFGGIARCDLIAEALIAAAGQVGFRVPVVVRLEGTNVEQARKLLADAAGKLPTLVSAGDLTDAARKVVAAAK